VGMETPEQPEDWNRTEAEYPTDCCLHELFEAQATLNPDAPALVHEGEVLSYGALNARANRLARHLRTLGIGPDRLVAIRTERSPGMVVALLAVLKAGGAYLPLDPAYPAERLAFMLADAAPAAVVTDRALGALAVPVPVVDLGADAPWAGLPDTDLDRGALTPRNLAYVIYTSGSTGTPKGVMVEHAGLVNLAFAQAAAFDVTPASRVFQFAPFSFDASAFEIVMALAHGAVLCLGPRGTVLAGEELADALRRCGATHVTLPPVVLAGLPDGALDAVRVLIVAGESPTAAAVARWGSGRRMFNAYGPTETTVWASLHSCDPGADPACVVPIGRPIANVRIYLLDEAGAPVPAGAAGEIHIGGAGVARGYLNRPELTAERFVASPFVAGDRLYRTGDLGRRRPDGAIEFLGRNDFQVKVRGFRIEPGEIEARLSSCPGVRDVVVVARDGRLAAYYTPAPGAEVGAEALRAHLASALPDHMVPTAYVRLDALPLTPNGKIDRAALPAPGDTGSHAHVAPVGPVETALAAIWAEVLGIGRVGRDDSFLGLGGDSLMAVQAMTRIRERFGRSLPVKALFTTGTVARVAELLVADGVEDRGETLAGEASSELRVPLSYQQNGVWLVEKLSPDSLAYNAQSIIRIHGEIDPELLRACLDDIVSRHEIFRTTFHEGEDGVPYQKVHAQARAALDLVDLPE
ncbi:MAG TPA: amino acid adenylation domain-containing protein, partial [Kaistia sp.]|nr:amino acid adenylation domain-containing protein [Kaistia sp.]